MRNHLARSVALGGVLAALAVVIMCLGGLIPIATYVCPMLCMLALQLVLRHCGRRMAWAWYGVVALLSLLMGPDKEAAAVFLFLGFYPILKPKLDSAPVPLLWKLLLFHAAIIAMYAFLIWLMGMQALLAEFLEVGVIGLAVMLILGNMTFFMLDMLLGRMAKLGR